MRTIICVVLLAILGCGGERDKGKNQDRERPKPPEKERPEKK